MQAGLFYVKYFFQYDKLKITICIRLKFVRPSLAVHILVNRVLYVDIIYFYELPIPHQVMAPQRKPKKLVFLISVINCQKINVHNVQIISDFIIPDCCLLNSADWSLKLWYLPRYEPPNMVEQIWDGYKLYLSTCHSEKSIIDRTDLIAFL